MVKFVAAALALFIAVPAWAQTPAEAVASGRAVALRSCTACHIVAERQARPASDAVPSFAEIAARPSTTADGLRTFIQVPHPPMPDLSLSRKELDGVVHYIMSLRRAAPAK